MNRKELVAKIIETEKIKGNSVTINQVDNILKSFFEIVRDEVKLDGSVGLVGFGTFKRATRAEYIGINPKTKEKIVIPSKNVAKFKPSANFLD